MYSLGMSSDTQLNEKEILTDMLQGAKHMAACYINAALECSNDVTRESLAKLAREKVRDAGLIYKVMSQKGWYKVEPAKDVRKSTSINPDNIQ
ncbi:spore coat protein [Petroclostridium xylanilyticum]|jgi:spore coat protein CotF|uniref:spore coat protein n=1 Tax=Petroclostridium xylanilyticum TaxID=1792311 RepID=UPI000B999ED3|nr:spore coat protein [Petroclostridium xylanilyticum]